MFAPQRPVAAQLSMLANASCESFMKTLKREEIYANEYRDLKHLRENLAALIDSYYNRVRLHSVLGYQPPEEFEQTNPATISQGATWSFFRREEIYRCDVGSRTEGEPATGYRLPPTIVSMSLRLVIPRRVALQCGATYSWAKRGRN
jgi:hypothetical protein